MISQTGIVDLDHPLQVLLFFSLSPVSSTNMINWYFGWALILSAFVTGAVIGLFFYSENFLGGYASFQRRILRLGHIAQAALGMMNVIAGNGQVASHVEYSAIAQWGLIVGGISMPTVCFLSAWKPACRHLFFVPVVSLMAAVVEILIAGPR
jgi:hypothetical protein